MSKTHQDRPTTKVSRRAVVMGAAAAPIAASVTLNGTNQAHAAVPNPFGPNVHVVDPSMSSSSIQSLVDGIFGQQENAQFDNRRKAIVFTPGSYNANVKVGFFTQVLGAGLSPDDTRIKGHVQANADWWARKGWGPENPTNATQNFWRGAENLQVTPDRGRELWAVSRAAPLRRMHIVGELELAQWFASNNEGKSGYGWASGGLLADSKVDGAVYSRTQQQFLTRNSTVGRWNDSNWNIMFVGCQGVPGNDFSQNSHKYTNVSQTPVMREKPFIHYQNGWKVFVPALRRNTSWESWAGGTGPGTSQDISKFYITKAGDSAQTMNAQLAAGKNLVITPGVYNVSEPLKITRANTVVLGLGLATLKATNGNLAIQVGDVDGVVLAGVMVDAGTNNSPTLVQIGTRGSTTDHSANPISLHDLYIRIGGIANSARADVAMFVHARHTIGDHLWIWRADHGRDGVAKPDWYNTTSKHGLIVEASDVTMVGLFVEHFQQWQTIWNGENGRTYFYQNETPYDAPSQSAWKSWYGDGWASYKVSDHVNTHEAWGLGSYGVYLTNYRPRLSCAFEVPTSPGSRCIT